MSNIIELNKKLFDTLEGLEKGTVEIKKAQAIVNVSNAICNNVKMALQAAKISKDPNIGRLMIGEDNMKRLETNDVYEKKLEFAARLGYKNISDAFSHMGKAKFEKEFKEEFQ